MRTTLDIPDEVYRRAKIRAIEQGRTLKELMLSALERELKASGGVVAETPPPYFARRKVSPELQKLSKSGMLKPKPGSKDITELISEDREERDT